MYANTEQILSAGYKKIQAEVEKYPKFVQRFNNFFTRRNEWLLLDRQHILLRNNNTNNYSESVMRVLKDIILNRSKAYNVTALLEYCITTWEDVLIAKLLDFAFGRRKTVGTTLSVLGKKMSMFSAQDIKEIGPEIFAVPSCSMKNVHYMVDMSVGTCTCIDGDGGAFCKHQCFVSAHMSIVTVNSPVLTSAERHNLATIALGKKCPPLSYFSDFATQVQTAINENTDDNNDSSSCALPYFFFQMMRRIFHLILLWNMLQRQKKMTCKRSYLYWLLDKFRNILFQICPNI